jgi:hypothetical protein
MGLNLLTKDKRMYLIFPESMIIPEVAARCEDNHFEDWLTAALIESTNRQEGNGESCLPGITDLWMLEVAERNGKTWFGRFQVEFETGAQGRRATHRWPDPGTGVLFFSLNTDTGEMRFA